MCSTRFTTCSELFCKTKRGFIFSWQDSFFQQVNLNMSHLCFLNLHWLPVGQRIIFKIALVTFKALHDVAPSYITELIRPYKPGRTLRSSSHNLLAVPRFNLKTYGGRSFTIAAPTIRNSLPLELRTYVSLSTFSLNLRLGYLKKLLVRTSYLFIVMINFSLFIYFCIIIIIIIIITIIILRFYIDIM